MSHAEPPTSPQPCRDADEHVDLTLSPGELVRQRRERARAATSAFNAFLTCKYGLVALVREVQAAMTLSDEEEKACGHSHLAKFMARVKKTDNFVLHWPLRLAASYPLLLEIAIILLVLVPHSCTVERICSMHKLVAPKIRSRLKHRTIQMLLYCFVNLRLINAVPVIIGDFLESALDDETNDGDALDDEPEFSRQVQDAMAAMREEVGSAAGPSAAADGVVVAVPGRAPRWSAQL